MNDPYLSIVVTSRNDNHGGDLLLRMTAFVNGLLVQTRRHKLEAELIIVEWNPPVGKPLLKDVLPKPAADDLLSIRYIIVPREVHLKFHNHDAIPLYQMIAKNVGIRRAKGKFILCTNIDILFTNECMIRLAKKNFEPNVYYRTNRIDVENGLLAIPDLDGQIAFGEKHIIKRIGKHETIKHIKGFPGFVFGFTTTMRVIDYFWGFYDRYDLGEFYPLSIIDTEACGDFTLMAKESWMEIDGYPELDMYSIHIDSMALYAAHLLKMRQEIFNYKECTYHIYHEEGWESIDDAVKMLRFLTRKPGLDWGLVVKATLQLMREGKQRYELNKPDWGFLNDKFDEYEFLPAMAQ